MSAIAATIFLFGMFAHVHACLSNGCCQQPQQACPAQCSPGYQCGSYGCARNRARSALTQKSERALLVPGNAVSGNTSLPTAGPTRNIFGYVRARNRAPTLVKELKQVVDKDIPHPTLSPNRMFLECCQDHDLPDACLSKCNFNTYTKQALMSMYLKQDACPIEAATAMQHCAARARDHRKCCAHAGVGTTLAGEKCLLFCDQRPGIVTALDFTYVACLDRFENMKRCFFDDAQREIAQRQQTGLADNAVH